MMAAEIVAGTIFGSMAIVADGWHMATHAAAMLIAALAYLYARKNARNPRFTFDIGKMDDLAGFASAIVAAGPRSLNGYTPWVGTLLKTNEIPASGGVVKSFSASKQSELVGIFSRLPSSLTRESNDVFILPVRKCEDMDISAVRQIVLDPPHVSLELFLAVAKSSID